MYLVRVQELNQTRASKKAESRGIATLVVKRVE
jgi:hypothetical protein